MVQLASWKEKFADVGVLLAGMTYDDVALLKSFHTQEQLGYPLLQDENTKHVDAYGIRNMSYEPGERGYGIPHPGVLFITHDGIVALKFAIPGYRQRPPLEEIYQAVLQLEDD